MLLIVGTAPRVHETYRLLLDSLKTYKMGSVRERLREYWTESEFIPPGITGLAQPMDVAAMCVFKYEVIELYVEHHVDNCFCASAPERRSS